MPQADQAGSNQPGSGADQRPADEVPSAPVSDDAGASPPAETTPAEDAPPQDEGGADKPSLKPPSDITRDKIFARFDQGREAAKEDGDEDAGADEDPQIKAIRKIEDEMAGGKPDDGAKPAPDGSLTLKVFGKDQSKSIDEIALLTDMTPEEVRQFPKQAVKLAQKQLAADHRLEETRRLQHEATSRANSGDADTRAERRAPDQGRPKAGEKDEGPDQRETPDGQPADEVDFQQLAEVLQIEDPKVAGQKLKEVVEKITASAKSAARETVSEEDRRKTVNRDATDIVAAYKDFTKARPDIAKNNAAHGLIATGLIDEYSDDLVNALVAEGEDPDEARNIVNQVGPDEIKRAHRVRRIKGDPNVRRISDDMFERAYVRAAKSIGLTVKGRTVSSEDLTATRNARKANLAPQPRRASVPSGTPEPAAKSPSRAQVVSEMAAARGQRGQPAAR